MRGRAGVQKLLQTKIRRRGRDRRRVLRRVASPHVVAQPLVLALGVLVQVWVSHDAKVEFHADVDFFVLVFLCESVSVCQDRASSAEVAEHDSVLVVGQQHLPPHPLLLLPVLCVHGFFQADVLRLGLEQNDVGGQVALVRRVPDWVLHDAKLQLHVRHPLPALGERTPHLARRRQHLPVESLGLHQRVVGLGVHHVPDHPPRTGRQLRQRLALHRNRC
mmetsp:Transcript_28566/g.72405  ORF Transcript_28566/g.72405 Transcript_28566/m.72405 type:complete len:219 (-) Transcript_28566:226-882(-)